MSFRSPDFLQDRTEMHHKQRVAQQRWVVRLEVCAPAARRFLQSNKESSLTKSFEVAYQLQKLVELQLLLQELM